MELCREYGNPPFSAIVLHGGPGAPGSCAGICMGIAEFGGALEHMQQGCSIEALLDEIEEIIGRYGLGSTVLVGHSWGAWLAFLCAAKRPRLVRKLILVGCGPFEVKYLEQLTAARKSRLTLEQQQQMDRAFAAMNNTRAGTDKANMDKFFELPDTDSFCPLPAQPGLPDAPDFNEAQYKALFGEIAPMRERGELLALAGQIRCPVAAIHGRQDPHPWQGVTEPLEGRLEDFRMVLLDRCGHEPWREQYAREAFFEILRAEIDRGHLHRIPL